MSEPLIKRNPNGKSEPVGERNPQQQSEPYRRRNPSSEERVPIGKGRARFLGPCLNRLSEPERMRNP
jgi:hypothetical protein